MPSLSNTHFIVSYNEFGALDRIVNPADPAGMNWVVNSVETPSHLLSHSWGLGYAVGEPHRELVRWQRPEFCEMSGARMDVGYSCGWLKLAVQRELSGELLAEQYVFTNQDNVDRWVFCLGVHTPLPDSYPDAKTCTAKRCHSHIWANGASSYVCSLRMGGYAPHLGLVLTAGSLEGYSIADRNNYVLSNSRGVITLNPFENSSFLDNPPTTAGVLLKPGESYTLAWTLFWHEGHEDFLAKAKRISPRFCDIRSESFFAEVGKPAKLKVMGAASRKLEATAEGQPCAQHAEGGDLVIEHAFKSPGTQTVRLREGNAEHRAVFYAASSLANLVRKRAEFIVEKQQFHQAGHLLDGAYLPYDARRPSMLIDTTRQDFNEGRERLGMGIFLALYLKRHKGACLEASLRKYAKFVREKLQDENYAVYHQAAKIQSHRKSLLSGCFLPKNLQPALI